LIVPLDELGDALTDITTRLVVDQLGGVRDIGVGVFGVAIAGRGVLDIERRIDLVADDFGEGGDVDVVGRANVPAFLSCGFTGDRDWNAAWNVFSRDAKHVGENQCLWTLRFLWGSRRFLQTAS